MDREVRGYRSPKELNQEFRDLMNAMPAVELNMLGTVAEVNDLEQMDLTEEELLLYEEMFGGAFDPHDSWSEIAVDLVRGEATRLRRNNSEYSRMILAKLAELQPYMQGTDTFKTFYVPREVERMLITGISDGGREHALYGNEMGGIFNAFSVEDIEERSLQAFSEDIKWYGVGVMGRVFSADYDNDEVYRDLVDRGRMWVAESTQRYGRVPQDAFGREIIIP